MDFEETDPATGYIPFRFTSKEYDEETGLYYHGARYYEPRLSRWMSADPAGFALINPMDGDGKPRAGYSPVEAANWYSYVRNNPVKYVDPTGETSWIVDEKGKYIDNRGYKNSSPKQSSLNAELESMGAEITRLGKLIKLRKLIRLLKKYSHLLDEKTRDFVNKTSKRALRKLLSGVNVFSLDREGMNKVKGVLDKHGVSSYMDDPAGIGFGNSIYIDSEALSDDVKGDLLGHEAIHILQTAAYGGLEGMFGAYNEDMVGMEAAAYSFEGGISDKSDIGERADLGANNPVFVDNPIRW